MRRSRYNLGVRAHLILTLLCGAATAAVSAQSASRNPASPSRLEPAALTCPSPLGAGVTSKRAFCDVPIGRTPADGPSIKLPPYRGAAVIHFDLHNRVVFSEEQVKARRSYALTTATIGLLTMDNTLIDRAVVQNEFRTASDLFERIGGGAGPGGLKAVAPSGVESVRIQVPAGVEEVCILGEKLVVRRFEGTETFTAPGRPIALVSNVMVEYAPAPVKKAPAKAPAKRPVRKAPVKK